MVDVRGGPRERGRQHGEACRQQIHAYPETLLRVLHREAALRGLGDGLPGPSTCSLPSTTYLYQRALTFEPYFAKYAPEELDEIRGIAEGAGLPFEAALLVNVRAEVAGLGSGATLEGGCTAFGAGGGPGGALLGQNLDQDPAMESFLIVLRVRPDTGPPLVMLTFGGLVGYPGVNGEGVAQFQNAVSNGVWRHALPHYPVKRQMFGKRSAQEAVATLAGVPVASCANYLLGDRSGALVDLESTPDGWRGVAAEAGVLVHTNHFLDAELAAEERLLRALPDSGDRLRRMRSLLAADAGRTTLRTVQRALSDHDRHPVSICRHDGETPGGMTTIASIVAEPEHGRLHVARGNPCENGFVAYDVP
jgi:isopenicillin-N N-acyltransferase-like protein